MNVLDKIEKEKLIAILRLETEKNLPMIIEHLVRGGIKLIEVTLNTPNALSLITKIKEQYPDLTVGAGTVLDGSAAKEAIESGADFMLAPTLKQETIQMGNQYGIPVIPGVFTPTEALSAHEFGASLVKVFPANQVSPRFIKDLNGPLPFIKSMAVGGVSPDNLQGYFEHGWHSVGLGSSLVNAKWVENGEFYKIEQTARQCCKIRDRVFTN